LKNIADGIHGIFVTTEAALRIAEFKTSDPQTKQNLALAINVLKVSKYSLLSYSFKKLFKTCSFQVFMEVYEKDHHKVIKNIQIPFPGLTNVGGKSLFLIQTTFYNTQKVLQTLSVKCNTVVTKFENAKKILCLFPTKNKICSE
jgi:hypothetical protein